MKYCENSAGVYGIEYMMTSSNGNIFRVTGPLCGEFTGPGEFPTQKPVTRSFDVFFDLRLNKRLSKQPWGWWFEMPSCPLWCHCNDTHDFLLYNENLPAQYSIEYAPPFVPHNDNLAILYPIGCGFRVHDWSNYCCQFYLMHQNNFLQDAMIIKLPCTYMSFVLKYNIQVHIWVRKDMLFFLCFFFYIFIYV